MSRRSPALARAKAPPAAPSPPPPAAAGADGLDGVAGVARAADITAAPADPLAPFHPAVRTWFRRAFGEPTEPQIRGWAAIARGESTLLLAPTGSGKTLAAFLYCLNRLLFEPRPEANRRCRVLYISPIKALAVDVERNLRAPLVGVARIAEGLGAPVWFPEIRIRTGDTSQAERARFLRSPSDILITTPESLFLLLTSGARTLLGGIDTVIIDEIHTLVGSKRGAHLMLSLERLQALCARPLQRIGLSATARPLDEVARFLGGALPAREQAPPPDEPLGSEPLPGEPPDPEAEPPLRFRPVTIVATPPRRRLALRIQVPVEDMAQLSTFEEIPSGSAAQPPRRPSSWSAIQPQLLELIRHHRTTLLFVNSRRVAERLAAALNDLAAEQAQAAAELSPDAAPPHPADHLAAPPPVLVRAHHGSLAHKQRQEIEDQLKLGQLRALVATSSLELGIDMGTVDLVVQIEAPPSVASGLQRIGRASHQVGGTSTGVIFPRFRADLLACAAAARAMREGRVEATRYPRSPLDVLAQQIVAAVAVEPQPADALFQLVRCAAPFAELSRAAFDGVLDLLSGRYPSDEFADLRPRLTWDRVTGRLTPREGAARLCIVNGGTIPDRGLFGVFLAGQGDGGNGSHGGRRSARVGELDEEMVFESRPGDTFLLGATTWRIDEITHDRVLVTPAPGEPGKMPFWRGDAPGRPLEFGEEIGRLCRELRELPPQAAMSRLTEAHALSEPAAQNLLRYLDEQREATRTLPDDQNIVIERYHDELGDLRLCVLTPLGGRVHAPWCLAVLAKLRARLGYDPESMWTDDGFVIRIPQNGPMGPMAAMGAPGTTGDAASELVPETELLLPSPEEAESLVLSQLGSSALLAAKFREAAARALLLPRRKPGTRAPLWHQRKRAADLLKVAAQYPSFPILLEAYRECLRDVFDLPALLGVLRRIRRRDVHITVVDTQRPSPFASALLFSYVAQYMYEGDAPLAERRAQALAIDPEKLRELLGTTDLRELLDAGALAEVEAQLQSLPSAEYPQPQLRSADALHDLLLRLGDLSEAEIALRCEAGAAQAAELIAALLVSRRIARVPLGGETRYIAVEDAARYRDGLGAPLPAGLPEALLQPVSDPLTGLCRRYARTHGPFAAHELAERFALPVTVVEPVLRKLCEDGRLLEGEFRPQGLHREFCDHEVLQKIRRKSLAKLRREIEPAPARALGRLYTHWQGVLRPRRGLDALLDAIQSLQGAPIIASTLETEVLPARISGYSPADLDTLLSAGEVLWVGVEPLGEQDGRLVLGLADQVAALLPPAHAAPPLSPRAQAILDHLHKRGASFFLPLHEAAGGGFTGDTVSALWDLVWQGRITNDTFAALRALRRGERARGATAPGAGPGPRSLRAGGALSGFRSRRASCPPAAQGRWSLVRSDLEGARDPAATAALAQQLLARYGVLTREAVLAEDVAGGFGAVYPALKAMEDAGRVRRGLLVDGLGATQFALPAALDLLRTLRDEPAEPEVVKLAAADPANPYGAALRWPAPPDDRERRDGLHERGDGDGTGRGRSLGRAAGSSVLLIDGALAAYLRRRSPDLVLFLPEDEPARSRVARAVARKLAELAQGAQPQPKRTLFTVASVNQVEVGRHPFASALREAGFVPGPAGYQLRYTPQRREPPPSFAHADYARYQSVALPPSEARPSRRAPERPELAGEPPGNPPDDYEDDYEDYDGLAELDDPDEPLTDEPGTPLAEAADPDGLEEPGA
ncbi:MAG: DEAD/DEAH box helicase [Polyangia bacterium]